MKPLHPTIPLQQSQPNAEILIKVSSHHIKVEVKVANFPEDIIVNDTRLNTSDYLSEQVSYNN